MTPVPALTAHHDTAVVRRTAVAIFSRCTVKPPIGNTPMAEHTADTEQFHWSQHAP